MEVHSQLGHIEELYMVRILRLLTIEYIITTSSYKSTSPLIIYMSYLKLELS